MTFQYSYSQFVNNVAMVVADQLPLTSYDAAKTLVGVYLDDIGWNSSTNGLGVPANNFTVEETAAAVIYLQINGTVRYTATANISINFDYYLNIPVDQNVNQVQNVLTSSIKDFLSTELQNKTNINFVNLISISGDISRGEPSPEDRVMYYNNISHNTVDPCVIALHYINKHYSNVDSTWNIASIYTDNKNGLCVTVKKFTNTSFTVLDSSAQAEYVIVMDRESYAIRSGLIRNYH